VPNTFIKIASVTVGSGGAANMEFTSIPQIYKDILIMVSARGTSNFAGSGYFMYVRPNGSSSNLSGRYLVGTGSSAVSGTIAPYLYMSPSDATASVFGNGQMYFPNYTSSNYKSTSAESVYENNATGAYQDLSAGLWSDTTAITSITLVPGGGNFAQYSTATLYGIKSS
jgi:hypothetical protein